MRHVSGPIIRFAHPLHTCFDITMMMPLSLSALIMAAVSVTVAEDQPAPAGAAVVDNMLACRSLTDPAARLACFDKTAAVFAKARDNRQVRVIDQEIVKRTKRSLFGLSLPDLNFFGGKDDNDGELEIREITASVTSVRSQGHGIYAIGLDDGSSWVFTEEQAEAPHRGDAVTIKRAALGSFKGSLNKRSAVRIRRER